MNPLEAIAGSGFRPGDRLAVAVAGATAGLAWVGGAAGEVPLSLLLQAETELQPRWVCWSPGDLLVLTRAGLRVARCWELATVHRLLFGGWAADPARIWAAIHDLDEGSLPGSGQLDLLGGGGDEGSDLEEPVRPDGHLRPEWLPTGWQRSAGRRARWAALALDVAAAQADRLERLSALGRPPATAQAESAAEQVCAELSVDGLPIDRPRVEELIAGFIGPRPVDEREALSIRGNRDREVLRAAPDGE